MYVCICNAITETELRASMDNGARTLEDLQLDTGVAGCCGTCADAAEALLATHCPGHAACHAALASPRTLPARLAAPRVVTRPAVSPVVASPQFAPVRWVTRAPHAMAKAA